MRKFWLLLFLLAVPWLKAQDTTQTVLLSAGAPSNPCTARRLDIDTTNNVLYFCSGGTWFLATNGGGGGAVTSVFTRTGAVVATAGDYTLDLIGNPAAAWTFDEGTTPNIGTITSNNNSAVSLLTLKDTNAGASTQGCLNFGNSGVSTGAVCFTGSGFTTAPNSLFLSSSSGSVRFATGGTTAGSFDAAQDFNVGTTSQFQVNSSGMISFYESTATTAGAGTAAGIAFEPTAVLTASLTANVGSTTLYAVPSAKGGIYRVTGAISLVTPAGTSSTLPNFSMTCTSRTGSGTVVYSPTMTFSAGGASGNTTASQGVFQGICDAKASTNILYSTTGYASNAANAMVYSLYVIVEYM